ncbi:polyphosphate kinase 1 [Butyricicoccus sp.]|uniref:polyphosphate kinase 1 n=1 Tax=Butyricicoccus sp. TaxID=2049021 RepID=UPI00373606DC
MLPKELLVNRELSWLEFNKRVLSEALRADVPLFERLKFAAIYFSNLDEFFMVRVGSLTDQSIMDPNKLDDKTGWNAAEQVAHMLEMVHSFEPMTEEMYTSLVIELKQHSIDFINFKKINKMDEMIAQKYFTDEIKPLLSPQIVDRHHPFPFLRNKEKYVVTCHNNKNGGERFGVIPIGHLPDYFVVSFDGRKKVLFTCDIVEHFIGQLFTKQKIVEKATIRVTRNADIAVDEALLDYDMDFRGVMQELLKKRRRLFAVRLQMSCKSEKIQKYLCEHLEVTLPGVFIQKIPLDFSFGFSLAAKAKENDISLFYPERRPQVPAVYHQNIPIRTLADNEILLAYPFHSYNPFLNMLYEAADDPEVVSIKISLYRLAGHSKVVSALCYAADRGKDVLCMLELRARFDEQSNIDYSAILEEAGCRVIYGLSDYKVHAKLCLITRKDAEGNVSYTTQVGTGNYNEKTSEQYTDLCFITNEDAVGRDATEVFNNLSIGETTEHTESLWVAPHCYRTHVLELLDREIEVQKNGGHGYVAMKINSFNDVGIMEKMVEASQAGVEIHLYIRGICCLRPGIEGSTDNITIRAILGRYLEHSRIFVFGEGDRQRIYLGSGDLLNRNTQRRVEIFAEPKSREIRKQLLYIMKTLETDNSQSWLMQPDGTYQRVVCPEGERPVNSQMKLYDYFNCDTVTASAIPPTVEEKPAAAAAPKAPPAEPQPKAGFFRRLLDSLFGR